MNTETLFSRKSDEWSTPQDLFDALHAEFNFTLDPCATAENAKCEGYIDAEMNGLSADWTGHRAFINPPYSKLKEWVGKCAYEAHHHGVLCVLLMPSRTDTRPWHDHIWDRVNHRPYLNVQIRFLKGRLKFGGATAGAPFPSAIVVFTPLPVPDFDAAT